MTKFTHLIELRWPTLATLALCALLPGCPVTDDYFIDIASAGAGQMVISAGGAEPNGAGAPPIAGSSSAGGAEMHPCNLCGDASGGSGAEAGMDSAEAGASDAGAGGDAGSSSSGSGGTGGSGGQELSGGASSAGSAGVAGSAGNPPTLPEPACADGVVKGASCTAASVQSCYKSCGPDNSGYKPEICQNGTYQEPQQGCTFPVGQDYSCYSLPSSLPAECPSGIPRGGRACQISSCTVCFGGSVFAPQYQDSTGVQKAGYCVCSTSGVWTCGSNNGSWPCPGGPGCN